MPVDPRSGASERASRRTRAAARTAGRRRRRYVDRWLVVPLGLVAASLIGLLVVGAGLGTATVRAAADPSRSGRFRALTERRGSRVDLAIARLAHTEETDQPLRVQVLGRRDDAPCPTPVPDAGGGVGIPAGDVPIEWRNSQGQRPGDRLLSGAGIAMVGEVPGAVSEGLRRFCVHLVRGGTAPAVLQTIGIAIASTDGALLSGTQQRVATWALLALLIGASGVATGRVAVVGRERRRREATLRHLAASLEWPEDLRDELGYDDEPPPERRRRTWPRPGSMRPSRRDHDGPRADGPRPFDRDRAAAEARRADGDPHGPRGGEDDGGPRAPGGDGRDWSPPVPDAWGDESWALPADPWPEVGPRDDPPGGAVEQPFDGAAEVAEPATVSALRLTALSGLYPAVSLLHRRRITKRRGVDHVLVGPAGVLVVDAKDWTDPVAVERDRLWVGSFNRTRSAIAVHERAAAVRRILEAEGFAGVPVAGALHWMQTGGDVELDGTLEVRGVPLLDALGVMGRVVDGLLLCEKGVERIAEVLDRRLPVAG